MAVYRTHMGTGAQDATRTGVLLPDTGCSLQVAEPLIFIEVQHAFAPPTITANMSEAEIDAAYEDAMRFSHGPRYFAFDVTNMQAVETPPRVWRMFRSKRSGRYYVYRAKECVNVVSKRELFDGGEVSVGLSVGSKTARITYYDSSGALQETFTVTDDIFKNYGNTFWESNRHGDILFVVESNAAATLTKGEHALRATTRLDRPMQRAHMTPSTLWVDRDTICNCSRLPDGRQLNTLYDADFRVIVKTITEPGTPFSDGLGSLAVWSGDTLTTVRMNTPTA